jgi:DNA helicase II / ATP-dependent DNA helicase PcrA
MSVAIAIENDIDDHVDAEIAECLDLSAPKSFFLFAGAGSGKTRSLISALQHIQKTSSDRLRAKGQRIAVITYTNAASEEIKRRLLFDPLIDVRTIHSFAWSLIDGLNHDIREWLRVALVEDLATLRADEAKGRKGTKASATRLSSIESKTKRLQNLPDVKKFVYSPTGDNRGRDSLNHSEVLQLTAAFLNQKPAMQSILAGRYPVLLIDESQDTNKHLIDALFAVQAAQGLRFTLGLLGDMMQRIYNARRMGDAHQEAQPSLPEARRFSDQQSTQRGGQAAPGAASGRNRRSGPPLHSSRGRAEEGRSRSSHCCPDGEGFCRSEMVDSSRGEDAHA